MKKKIWKSALFAMAGIGLMAGSAMAITLPPLTGSYEWTSIDYWTLADLSDGQAAFQLTWENPGAVFESSFGIYALTADGKAVGATHEIFAYSAEPTAAPGTSASVWFKMVDGSWKISDSENGTYTEFGSIFGFYSDVYANEDAIADFRWYSDTQFNSEQAKHFFIAYDKINYGTEIYLEDYPGGVNPVDLLVTSSDLIPAPEPAIMLLFGSGLAGLAAMARRPRKSKD